MIRWSSRGLFRDRIDAGRRVAEQLLEYKDQAPTVLGLPRGGVPVAAEIAIVLEAPLDVVVVRKLGVPIQPELAMGAIGEGGVRIVDPDILRWAGVGPHELARVEAHERSELARRARMFRAGRPPVVLANRTAIIVDDGIATGSTARAACEVAKVLGATRTVLAVPVAPPTSLAELAKVYDEIVCLATPEPFVAVGVWYDEFDQTSDDEVVRLLTAAYEATCSARRYEVPGAGGDRG